MQLATPATATNHTQSVEAASATWREVRKAKGEAGKLLELLIRLPKDGLLRPIKDVMRIVKAEERKLHAPLLEVDVVFWTCTVMKFAKLVWELQQEVTTLWARIEEEVN